MYRTVLRLLLLYLVPLIFLTIFFQVQSRHLALQHQRLHLQAVAEHQARMLDLFINERLVNLGNLADDPSRPVRADQVHNDAALARLQRTSDSFVDLGFFDGGGIQQIYSGPFPALAQQDYSGAGWFGRLRDGESDQVITDIYLGRRNRPHFTIAVRRFRDGDFIAARATLDPEKIYEYITSLEGARGVATAIVNLDGTYQLVTPYLGEPLTASSIVPSPTPAVGYGTGSHNGESVDFGYAWMAREGWAVIALAREGIGTLVDARPLPHALPFALAAIVIVVLVILLQARRQVAVVEERDETLVQLAHAAKLATVGELAGGIAHEINNPLAVISEEAGLMKDMLDPQFDLQPTDDDLRERLKSIEDSVFRCRDITRKLLFFVRSTDFNLVECDLAGLVDDTLEGWLANELTVANIDLVRHHHAGVSPVLVDCHQLAQVVINLVNNAADAITERWEKQTSRESANDNRGRITVTTTADAAGVYLSVDDDGCGMTAQQREKIFLPFYTTKEVGKGTGLGLSVSYGIIKGLDGTIAVQSEPGRGSTFTITFPPAHERTGRGAVTPTPTASVVPGQPSTPGQPLAPEGGGDGQDPAG